MAEELTVTRLSTTPVKGLALHHPRSIELTPEGAAGDRLFYLLDDHGKIQSCTANAGLLGLCATYDPARRRLEVSRGAETLLCGEVAVSTAIETDMFGLRTIGSDVVADPAWGELFSDLLGKRVHLVRGRTSAYDVRPVTLLGTSSVEELARQSGLPGVDARRFRMLVEFSGGAPHVEDTWDGTLLRVGDAVLRAGGPVKRCAATTRHPESGRVDLQTLRLISGYRGRQRSVLGVGAMFGVYADVVEPGTITVGDGVRVG